MGFWADHVKGGVVRAIVGIAVTTLFAAIMIAVNFSPEEKLAFLFNHPPVWLNNPWIRLIIASFLGVLAGLGVALTLRGASAPPMPFLVRSEGDLNGGPYTPEEIRRIIASASSIYDALSGEALSTWNEANDACDNWQMRFSDPVSYSSQIYRIRNRLFDLTQRLSRVLKDNGQYVIELSDLLSDERSSAVVMMRSMEDFADNIDALKESAGVDRFRVLDKDVGKVLLHAAQYKVWIDGAMRKTHARLGALRKQSTQ